jgi:hypothetical protein
VLTRADLIAIGNAAADAAASGRPMPKAQDDLPNRRFELYLPFGCDGPAAEGADTALRWRYDAAASALRLHVAPVDWLPTDWWQTPPPGIEALEGFWIARPWSSRETCGGSDGPFPPPGTEPITIPGQTLGIAQIIASDTPRQLRRDGRPYQATVRVAQQALHLDAGLRVRVRGRLAQFPQGGAVRCTQPGGREQRPICLIAMSLDEVAIENPATQEVLATWTPTTADSRSVTSRSAS